MKQCIRNDLYVYVIEIGLSNDILENAPTWWNSGDKSKYDNLIFILSDDSPEDIYKLVGGPTENLEQIQIYQNVIFWTYFTIWKY